jgi:hypothetical protein
VARRAALATISLAVLIIALIEARIWRDAMTLASRIESNRIENVEQAWKEYHTIQNRTLLPLARWTVRGALRDRLIERAVAALDDFRNNDEPQMDLPDWTAALADVHRARILFPDRSDLHGLQLLCDGHVQRLRGRSKGAAQARAASVARLQEAAKLLPNSPDPHLALARVYIYGMGDVEKGYAALLDAERRKHKPGRRERRYLADGYRNRGRALMAEASKLRGFPEQERAQLRRAQDDLQRARDLYQGLIPYSASTTWLVQAEHSLRQIEGRMAELGGTPGGVEMTKFEQ